MKIEVATKNISFLQIDDCAIFFFVFSLHLQENNDNKYKYMYIQTTKERNAK